MIVGTTSFGVQHNVVRADLQTTPTVSPCQGCPKTPKVHVVLAHVAPFCQERGKGLGSYSEQTLERLHSKWSEATKYKLRMLTTDSEYGNVLLKAVKDFNSNRLC